VVVETQLALSTIWVDVGNVDFGLEGTGEDLEQEKGVTWYESIIFRLKISPSVYLVPCFRSQNIDGT
jgi:hypothetical protein